MKLILWLSSFGIILFFVAVAFILNEFARVGIPPFY